MINKFKKYFFIAALALISVSSAAAHSGGFTYEVTQDNFFVDIGSNKLEFMAGELALFEYNLYPSTDPNNLADFDNVYVTVGNEESVLLSTYVHRPGVLLTVMSFAFPEAGAYEMSARFQKGGETLTEVSFPVTVMASGIDQGMIKVGAIFAMIGLAVGVLASRIVARKTS